MKDTLKVFAYTAVGGYLAFAYTFTDFHPASWPEDGRAFHTMATLMITAAF